ncbi:MAG: hypothetical protein ABIR32_18460 [Ilumatobacteraceae bacterium]
MAGSARRFGAGAMTLVAAAGLMFGGCTSNGEANDGVGGVGADKGSAATSIGPIASGEAPVRVEQISAAIAMLETKLGAPQQYFEINATPSIVNLFVAIDGATQAVAYVYLSGDIGEPAAPLAASGPTFVAGDLDFDPGLVLAKARAELPTSDFRLFSITGVAAGGAQYRAIVQSTKGTEFAVFLSGSGSILGTDQSFDVPTTTAGS